LGDRQASSGGGCVSELTRVTALVHGVALLNELHAALTRYVDMTWCAASTPGAGAGPRVAGFLRNCLQ
jgi:hypothetical protein